MTAMDGSILKTFDYLNNNGLQGFVNLWPKPTLLAFQIIAVYAVFEATLQLLLPGQTVYGPISPTGNRPVYKVCVSLSLSLFFCMQSNHTIDSVRRREYKRTTQLLLKFLSLPVLVPVGQDKTKTNFFFVPH
jgi:hypothetical protein